MVLLDQDQFLSELTRMFQRSRAKGSVTLVMKRYDGRNRPEPREGKKPLPEPEHHFCLIRATLRNKTISTVVAPKDVNKFQLAYSSLLKGNLDGLKKTKKVKSKSKATQ
ncbi:signal recognition particle 14 kDa protein [Frankliniella occidentalis]|uniref:Signal recognition particle 14 kDa protein n=1 Tax=Frankliniella occidentalis TaxID=133901 RepID=A0A6J1S374_FRAOC|nr:signal recognition particle 14 kDa protein [Frankliniella occidentalis]